MIFIVEESDSAPAYDNFLRDIYSYKYILLQSLK